MPPGKIAYRPCRLRDRDSDRNTDSRQLLLTTLDLT